MSKAAKGLSLFEKARAKAKKGAKALKELEKGLSTRAGGKSGAQVIPGTTTRNLGKGFGLKDPKTGRMLTTGQRAKVVSSGRKRIGAGAAAAGAGTYALTRGGAKDKTKEDTKTATGAGKNGKNGKTGKTTTTAKKDDGKKTFRERRLARMKKRLEGAENEGRKRRLKRRITRVEGRIEDANERKAKKKNMGGMMKSKGMAKGGKKPPGFNKGDLVEGGVKLLQKMGQRAFKEKYGEAATNRAKRELNKISGVTPAPKKPKTEKQKKLAGADAKAAMTQFTKQTPAAKKQAQVKTTEKRLERGFSNGGMAKKGYSKGGAARKSKPRGVGAALRGYGKAMR